MKVKVSIDSNIDEDEVVIYCKEYSDDIKKIKDTIENYSNVPKSLVVYQNETEYYLKINEILFIQSEGRNNYVHTNNQYYLVKEKLYQLEEILPRYFVRVSKSAIVNIFKVFAINRSFTSYGDIEFKDSNKKLAISRSYYASFKQELEERRNLYGKK